ncbi:Hypothetical protein LUCI_0598 [Lucifera butyrica]|uniref:Peptidase m24 methionine aminopeptidase n=1 Tax=Lucifera butyrica TaxID=1351585 RepID=A0A498R2J8_9FIRM|nr:M24 family metallopeptidase [Lucifera butyrica]VBB05389.1 Hypothetical protein LUCI_0598 [Lucifera butyrica]
MTWSVREYDAKLKRVRALMAEEGIENLLITTQVNFLWFTGGRPYVNPAVEKACGDLLVTGDSVYLVANNIEAGRLITEELTGLPITKVEYAWWEAAGMQDCLTQITAGRRVWTDVELGEKFASLRWRFEPEESERYADTGRCVGKVLEQVAYSVEPGMSELAIAAMIRERSAELGLNPWVNLVAVDERVYQYRHPLPTDRKLRQYVMLVLTAQKQGLFAAATRLVHFGRIPLKVKQRHEAVLKVDVAFIGATKPGAVVGDIFAGGQKAYKTVGFPEEWQYHHQGGMAGYQAREFRGTALSPQVVKAGQVYAWNPSIAGVKSEDTFMVGEKGPVVLTSSKKFPLVEVEYNGCCLARPDILIR